MQVSHSRPAQTVFGLQAYTFPILSLSPPPPPPSPSPSISTHAYTHFRISTPRITAMNAWRVRAHSVDATDCKTGTHVCQEAPTLTAGCAGGCWNSIQTSAWPDAKDGVVHVSHVPCKRSDSDSTIWHGDPPTITTGCSWYRKPAQNECTGPFRSLTFYISGFWFIASTYRLRRQALHTMRANTAKTPA